MSLQKNDQKLAEMCEKIESHMLEKYGVSPDGPVWTNTKPGKWVHMFYDLPGTTEYRVIVFDGTHHSPEAIIQKTLEHVRLD